MLYAHHSCAFIWWKMGKFMTKWRRWWRRRRQRQEKKKKKYDIARRKGLLWTLFWVLNNLTLIRFSFSFLCLTVMKLMSPLWHRILLWERKLTSLKIFIMCVFVWPGCYLARAFFFVDFHSHLLNFIFSSTFCCCCYCAHECFCCRKVHDSIENVKKISLSGDCDGKKRENE